MQIKSQSSCVQGEHTSTTQTCYCLPQERNYRTIKIQCQICEGFDHKQPFYLFYEPAIINFFFILCYFILLVISERENGL